MTATLPVREHRNTTRRRRWPWLAAALGVVLLAAGIPSAVWFVHWRSSLHSLVDYPTYGAGGGWAIGRPEYFGGTVVAAHAITHPNDPGDLSIHISAVRPIVRQNSADAQIRVLLCVLTGPGGGLLGQGRADARSTCSSLTPFRSGSVTVGFTKGDDDIVVCVTPRQPGKVRISGVEIEYSSGLRYGTQHVGAQISMTTH